MTVSRRVFLQFFRHLLKERRDLTRRSIILEARQRICDGFFKGRSAFPLVSRTASAVRADLIHGGVDLDLITVRVVEFDSRVSCRTAPSFVVIVDSVWTVSGADC